MGVATSHCEETKGMGKLFTTIFANSLSQQGRGREVLQSFELESDVFKRSLWLFCEDESIRGKSQNRETS